MNHTPSVSVRNIVLGEGIPKICIPLVSTCLDALLNDMKKALILLNGGLTGWMTF